MPQPYIDITGATAYREATGNGTLATPYIPSFTVIPPVTTTSTITNVSATTTSVTLLSSNSNRKTVIIVNDSTTADLYITLNPSIASISNFSLFVGAKVGNTPAFAILNGSDYSGEIRGIWVVISGTISGNARITEIS